MLASVFSCALIGLDGTLVQVQVDLNAKAVTAVAHVGPPT